MQSIIKKLSSDYLRYSILFVSLAAVAGSLFFSEVMKLPPCVLCWYQRIFMYPIALLSIVGIVRQDKSLPVNVLALSVPGLLISVYHNLLYWKILPESVAPCTLGISCTTKFFEWFGFVTIPFLSLLALSIITAHAIILLKKQKHEKS